MNDDKSREEFEAWFKDYYIKHGFITSKEEAFEIWQASRQAGWRPIEEAPKEAECGCCGGTGRMVRDPDIGTDQECFACDGTGRCEDEPVQPLPAPPKGE